LRRERPANRQVSVGVAHRPTVADFSAQLAPSRRAKFWRANQVFLSSMTHFYNVYM
jgi:hypothetical protein